MGICTWGLLVVSLGYLPCAVGASTLTLRAVFDEINALVDKSDVQTLIELARLQGLAGYRVEAGELLLRATKSIEEQENNALMTSRGVGYLYEERPAKIVALARIASIQRQITSGGRSDDLPAIRVAQAMVRTERDPVRKIHLLQELARIQSDLGDPQSASLSLRDSLQLTKDLENSEVLISTILASLASLDRSRGDTETASASLLSAVEVARKIPRLDERAEALSEVALVLAKWGQQEEANKLFEEALVIFAKSQGGRFVSVEAFKVAMLLRRAEVCQEVNNISAAFEIVGKAKDEALRIKQTDLREAALRNVAIAQARLGDTSGALQTEQVIESPQYKGQALPYIATILIRSGNVAGVGLIVDQLKTRDRLQAFHVLEQLGIYEAKAGKVDSALRIAYDLPSPFNLGILREVSSELTHSGQTMVAMEMVDREKDKPRKLFLLLGIADGMLATAIKA